MTDKEPDFERENEKEATLSPTFSASFQFVGPLPPPSVLAQYEKVSPGTAERIISIAEKEQQHRHAMQGKLVDSQVEDARRERNERRLGQIFGLIIGVFAIGAGSLTAILGSQIAGGFIGTTGVGGLVSVFVLGRRGKEQQNHYSQAPADDGELEEF